MSRLGKRFWVVLFPLVLLAPTISSFLPIDRVEIDNKRLVAPKIDAQNLTDPRFYRSVLAYARDASPIRARLIQGSSLLDFKVFGDSPAPNDVLVGDGGWLYGREAIRELCAPASATTAAQNLVDTVDFLRSQGVQTLFTVAPAKFAIHPEHLTDVQAELAECAKANDEILRQYFAGSDPDGLINSWSVFETLKSEGTDPYFKTDTHFNYAGSIPWMKALVTALDRDIWDEDAIVDYGRTDFIGNLMTLIGLGRPESARLVIIDRGLPRTPTEQLHDRFSEEQTATERYLSPPSSTAVLIEGRVIVLKDSFMDLPAPSFAQYFHDLTVTDWRSQDSVDYFIQNALAADVVIIQTAEHSILERFAHRSLREALQQTVVAVDR